VAVNDVKSSVSSDDFSQLLKPGITLDAILDPATHGLHPLSDFVLGHLPLNGDRYKQLSYELNGLVAQHNPDLAREFFRSLGPHPLCPVHPLQRRFSPTQLDLHHRLVREEKDKARLTRLKEQAPRQTNQFPYPENCSVYNVLGFAPGIADA